MSKPPFTQPAKKHPEQTLHYSTTQESLSAAWCGTHHHRMPVCRSSPTLQRGRVYRWRRWLRRHCRAIVEHKCFILFGTLVTVWALAGDDLRLWCTNKPADVYFDGIVVFNIVFFTFEIVVSCLGKDDYFLGFFFGLDVVSTATLFLDLSQVSEAMFGGGDSGSDSSDNARTGRTARVGAKIGRVVRVLRLIRIVKLYKAFTASKSGSRPPRDSVLEEDWENTDEFEAEEATQPGKESLVGKKLSAMTTQRTIILVLTLLIALPSLSTSSLEKLPASAQFGAEEVSEAFDRMLQGTSTRDVYEQVMLKYMFYHNWFQGRMACLGSGGCSNTYYSHAFWVGIAGQVEESVVQNVGHAQISREKVLAWNSQAQVQDDLYNFGTLPAQVLDILSAPWETDCRNSGNLKLGFSVLSQEITDTVSHAIRCPEDVRNMEKERYAPRLITGDRYNQWHFVFYFDLRPYVRQEASLNILTTIFICVVLCVASLFFSNDANTLVLTPVEQMMTKVEAIQDNPLRATEMADEAFKREEMKKSAEEKVKSYGRPSTFSELRKSLCCCGRRAQRGELMETVILEKTIIKLGSLLALGFGEAGANIVSQNMKGNSSSGVNAMVSGQRVDAIVGNVRIRDFSTATEVLQEQVMQFVNQIAEIVHGVVDEFHGAANKNMGEVFLIIWRTAGVLPEKVQRLADMSVYAFAKILGGVHRSNVLATYRYHPGLQQRLGSDCRVNLSFGLHCGWTIEGAVGSEFKIDASYLSPNVHMATQVENATRIYSVSILVSQAVVDLCSRDLVDSLRLIDKVRFMGSNSPIHLYCLDLDYLCLSVEEPLRRAPVWNTQMRYRSRQHLEDKKRFLWSEDADVSAMFKDDNLIACMRSPYSEDFRQHFNMGYQNYAQGEWLVARTLLSKTLAMVRMQDGPSLALLRFMGIYQFKAPSTWASVRDLGNLEM